MKSIYPSRNGIAVPVYEVGLVVMDQEIREKNTSIHHVHFTAAEFGRSAVTLALRELERHQYNIYHDDHLWLHDTFDPPRFPTEEQALKEIMDAHEKREYVRHKLKYGAFLRKPVDRRFLDNLIAEMERETTIFDMATG